MKNRAKRWIGILLAVCLVMAMLPTAALAVDTGKAIQLVLGGSADNIGGKQADSIYFGTYYQSNGSTKEPVKWRVLSNGNQQLFLLSDQNLDVFQYHTEQEYVTWETSTMRSWLNGYDASANTGGSNGTDYTGDNFLAAAFSAGEQRAIATTTVVNDENTDYGTDGGNDTNDRIFLLSIEETDNRNYFPQFSSSRYSTNTAYVADGGKLGISMAEAGEGDWWWLRSPGSNNTMAAFIEEDGGDVYEGNPVNNKGAAVRPAFNLDLDDVLFTSAAEGGKSASGMDNGLTAVANYSGNEWKLTLLDGTRGFDISNVAWSGNTLTFSYSRARTGSNEYISAIIEENGAITYYGRILQLTSESGTASLSLPSGVTLSDTTKLHVFNEQVNGDKRTDYASGLSGVSAPEKPAITTTNLSGGKVGEAYSQTLAATGAAPITWSIESGSLPAGLTLSGNTISGTPTTAGTFTFTVKAGNSVGNDTKELSIVIQAAPVEPDPGQPPVITTTTLSGGKVGEAYSQTLAATGAAPITWSIESGSLPAGLTLSGNTISGTPTTAGTFTFTVKAGNSVGNDTKELSIVVQAAPVEPDPGQPPVITSPTTDQKITVAVDDTATLRVTAQDAQSYQWYADRGSGFKAISGATGASYTTSPVTLENDGYRYYCVAANADGTARSPIFTLNVREVEEVPPTGDSSQMGLWLGLALLSFAGLAAGATLWRRKRAS